ncbi:MAG: 4-hydroxy-3-methylbut-2-enyl diphosphate reductase, partial [Lachnospiraceae bacterium]|nr:4-hydroxy-3-methylbut-2-enyl diphosphate reductase [Lachnospiraceae bacterium]
MEVKLARSAGFCFGVKRAMDMVYQQIGSGKKIYTYGPIIHNEEVVKELEQKGVTVLRPEETDSISEGTVIIRSHGIERAVQEKLIAQGLECVDATCPFVKRIHATVERESRLGKQINIAGNPEHPEVQGIMAWCEKPAIVIKDESE